MVCALNTTHKRYAKTYASFAPVIYSYESLRIRLLCQIACDRKAGKIPNAVAIHSTSTLLCTVCKQVSTLDYASLKAHNTLAINDTACYNSFQSMLKVPIEYEHEGNFLSPLVLFFHFKYFNGPRSLASVWRVTRSGRQS